MQVYDKKTSISTSETGFNLCIKSSDTVLNIYSLSVQDLINLRAQVEHAYTEHMNKPKEGKQ